VIPVRSGAASAPNFACAFGGIADIARLAVGTASDRVAESAGLDHGEISKRERSSIVAKRHAVHAAEGITSFERTRRGCNPRLHLNTATLVTPTVRFAVPN
jgi:hypothetical protein